MPQPYTINDDNSTTPILYTDEPFSPLLDAAATLLNYAAQNLISYNDPEAASDLLSAARATIHAAKQTLPKIFDADHDCFIDYSAQLLALDSWADQITAEF